MILLTDDLRERLLANGRDRGADHVPVVKFFNPLGEGVWLATGLGSFSLEELASIFCRSAWVSSATLLHGRFPDLGLGGGRARVGKHPGAERILYRAASSRRNGT